VTVYKVYANTRGSSLARVRRMTVGPEWGSRKRQLSAVSHSLQQKCSN